VDLCASIHPPVSAAYRDSRWGLTTLLGLALAFAMACGGGSSSPASAPVAPAITTQPTSLAVNQGAAAAFTVVASGTAPLHYQWKLGTTNVGSDAATLSLASAQPTDAGSYTVTVSNTAGSVTSSAVVLTVNAASSTPANVNLALGKTATASSTESASYPAALAVDGQVATRWSSLFTDTEWLRVDLGAAQTFNRVVLRWEAAYGRGYVLEGSSDGATWAPFYSQTSGTGGVEDLSFTSTTARYVRLRGTARATVYGYSLYELEVYRSVPCTLTATAGAHGTVSPAGAVSVVPGRSQTFTFTPDSGYTVDTVTVDGVSVGAVASYTFANVLADHTLSVTFKVPAIFTITASAGPNGTISPSGAVSVTQGTSQTFTLTPGTGFAITGLSVDGVSVSAGGSYTFTNVQAAHTLAATFGTTGGLVWSDEFNGPDIDPSKWAFDLGNGLTLTPHVGRQTIPNANNLGDYTDYSLTLAKDFGNGLSVSLSAIGTDADDAFYKVPGFDNLGKSTAVLGLKYSF